MLLTLENEHSVKDDPDTLNVHESLSDVHLEPAYYVQNGTENYHDYDDGLRNVTYSFPEIIVYLL